MAGEKSSTVETLQHITWSYQENKKTEDIPWGPHKLPVALDLAGVSIVIEKVGNGHLYKRVGAGGSAEKTVLADKGSLLLSPVEPLHKPTEISTHILIEFEKTVVIEPRTNREIMVTFPLELACILDRRRVGEHVLDIFTFSCPKFTLYGKVKDGMVCKYWKSAIYSSVPMVNPLEMGIMKIVIQNSTGRWAEINRAVFSAYGMKIYFNPKLVSLNATMKINSEITADTNFNDQPLQPGMHKAMERFSSRLLSLPGRTVMEEGY